MGGLACIKEALYLLKLKEQRSCREGRQRRREKKGGGGSREKGALMGENKERSGGRARQG
ncbi:unnamed protein product [Prunus armeniaca]